jgi:membrane-associated phospholipid phosphatase
MRRSPKIVVALIAMVLCPPLKAQAEAPNAFSAEDAAPNRAETSNPASTNAHLADDPGQTPGAGGNQNGKPAAQSSTGILRAGSTCDLVSSTLTCVTDVFRDQGGIWTAPARLRGKKLLWLLPFAAATAVALKYDVTAMNALGPSATRVRVSNDYTYLGSGYVLVPAAGLTYLIGKLDHKERTRETGILSLEAVADAGIVVEGLKLATNRQRPYVAPGTGKFWPDDTDFFTTNGSFPSGHSAAAWALVRVMVDETPGHRWLHVALYGLASSVALARVTGENHFPSDILVGSVIGYTVGGYVYHRRSAFYIPKAKSVQLGPLYNPATASYGVSLSVVP